MSKTKLLVHLILVTKYRQPLITHEVEGPLYQKIKQILIDEGCYYYEINGIEDHVHVLFNASPQIALTDLVHKIKGTTSRLLNAYRISRQRFKWQTGYAAFAVSESHKERVSTYIQKQKEHHKKQVFAKEYKRFLELHGLRDTE